MTKPFLILTAVTVAATLHAQTPRPQAKAAPTVDQILSLHRAGAPEISPDGQFVAYTLRETSWDDNSYETEIWVADARGTTRRELTHAKKSSLAPAWSPVGS